VLFVDLQGAAGPVLKVRLSFERVSQQRSRGRRVSGDLEQRKVGRWSRSCCGKESGRVSETVLAKGN